MANGIMGGNHTPIDAKTENTTDAINYSNGPAAPAGATVGNWRLPNQRELALMVMFNRNFYNRQNGFKQIRGLSIQNRTTFYLNTELSLPPYNLGIYREYTPYGFFYDSENSKIQCSGGNGPYFCVRDVQ